MSLSFLPSNGNQQAVCNLAIQSAYYKHEFVPKFGDWSTSTRWHMRDEGGTRGTAFKFTVNRRNYRTGTVKLTTATEKALHYKVR